MLKNGIRHDCHYGLTGDILDHRNIGEWDATSLKLV
jgi:hypothetical protein